MKESAKGRFFENILCHGSFKVKKRLKGGRGLNCGLSYKYVQMADFRTLTTVKMLRAFLNLSPGPSVLLTISMTEEDRARSSRDRSPRVAWAPPILTSRPACLEGGGLAVCWPAPGGPALSSGLLPGGKLQCHLELDTKKASSFCVSNALAPGFGLHTAMINSTLHFLF